MSQIRQLLNENSANPPDRQLPVQNFDVDKTTRRKKLEDGKTDREKAKQIELATIKSYNKISEMIIKICWDSIFVKGRELHAILRPTIIQSYALLPESPPSKISKNFTDERVKLEIFFHKGDFFEPWVPMDERLV